MSESVIVIISGASLLEGSSLAEATCSLHGIQKKLGKDLQVPRRIVQTREESFWFGSARELVGLRFEFRRLICES